MTSRSEPSGPADLDAGRLPAIADAAIAGLLDRDPVEATYLGDHTHDTLLPDPSAAAAQRRAAEVRTLVAALDALPAATPDDDVDAAVLRTVHAAELLDLDRIREAEWNPMLYNPGTAIHSLLHRDFAPLPDRLRSVAARLAAIPDCLATARTRWADLSAVHLDTAVDQLDGTVALLGDELAAALEQSPALRVEITAAAADASAALVEHRDRLEALRPDARRDPRLGADLFRAKLALVLDTTADPLSLLRAAEADLERITAEIVETAGRLEGVAHPDADTVRTVLDRLARDAADDDTVLGHCRSALVETTAFVRDHDLVTVPDDPIGVVVMPEVDRGVAVAYCRPRGPLETADLATEFAVSPAPSDWPAERVRSFYREYNTHMLHNLTVHEAMPGHALQLMHAARATGSRTRVRAVWSSGSFVEGWAVYAEELMAHQGYRSAVSARAAAAVQLQQLKMQLRTTINAILDIRFHCEDLDERGALHLMCERGFQEIGEAAGKWRRVQLTSTQLCTYYVGYREVRDAAADLAAARPGRTVRQRHDALLAHGSPPARHLRTLLGLDAGRG